MDKLEIPMEMKQKQIILENVRQIMKEELSNKGLNEAMLVNLGIDEDFNDEIYLVTEIINHDIKFISVSKMFSISYKAVQSFINNYIKDNMVIDDLNKGLSEDMKKKLIS